MKVVKKVGILTGGGDVPPLNAIIASVKTAAQRNGLEAIGFIKGWEGVLAGEYVPLKNILIPQRVGGTILKSSRINLLKIRNGADKALETIKELCLDALIIIGGEDTLSNAFLLPEIPCILISKTIDNDVGTADAVFLNYFTFGYPTAANKIISYVSQDEGIRSTAYSHERIVVVESMGMHAGWLCLAAGMADPDIIIIPEIPLHYDHFLDKIVEVYRNMRHAVIVVAEGARWSDGTYLKAPKDEGQGFDHPRFGGSSSVLAERMRNDLKNHLNTRNINAVNPSYLYRSGLPCVLEQIMAERIGIEAIRIVMEGNGTSMLLSIRKTKEGFDFCPLRLDQYKGMSELHRFVNKRFYDSEDYRITPAGKEYLRAIVKEKPTDRTYGIGY